MTIVILTRHADEPIPETDSNIHLSELGKKRAEALANHWEQPLGLPIPEYCFATSSKNLTKSNRSVETATYIANKFNIQLNQSIEKKNYDKLVTALKTSHYGVVYVAWQHTTLQEIIKSLSGKSVTVEGYDQLFKIDLKTKTLTILKQGFVSKSL